MKKLHWAEGLVPGVFGVRLWLAMVIVCTGTSQAAGLNDTGITKCWNDTAAVTTGVEADNGSHPRQDCRYGRDAAAAAGMAKIGAGDKGFDFSKIANDGTVLAATAILGAGAKDWACTRDNVTGLVWEIKTTSGLRNQDYTYSWFNSDITTNGGGAGTASGGTCSTNGRCDTEKYVVDVNAAGLCGASDWRMPARKELDSIIDYGRSNPAFDPIYFPNTPALSYFWSTSAYAAISEYAWGVHFGFGYTYGNSKDSPSRVRLVRAGP